MDSSNQPVVSQITYYKNVWQTITTHDGTVNDQNVSKVLTASKTQLIKGILIYEPYTVESFTEWKEKYAFADSELQRFVHKLSVALNLNSTDLWNLFCNYLMFEYYGRVTEMNKILRINEYSNSIVDSVWYFYTCERMYILKSVRYILENFDKSSNFFQHVYGKYVDVLVPDIFASLLKQMQYLVNEINLVTCTNCVSKKEWIDRNNREQLEVVLSMIIAMKHYKMDMSQYVQMLNIFKQHNFTKQPLYFDLTCLANVIVTTRIRYAEIGACLVGLQHCWADNNIWTKFITQVEDVLISFINEGDHSIILLAWSVLQLTQPFDVAIEAFHSKYNAYITYAFRQHVFHQMYEMASCNAIMNCNVGPLIRKAMFVLLEQSCDKFDKNGDVYNSRSSCLLFSELIKDAYVADICFKASEDGVASLYNSALRAFPYHFSNITYIYTALASYELFRTMILTYLMEMPSYTEEYVIEHSRDFVQVSLTHEYEAVGAEIVFPVGTDVIFWKCCGKSLLTLKANCEYITIFKNIINDVIISATVHENAIEAICSGYKLLLLMLKVPRVPEYREVQQCIGLTTALLLKFTRDPFQSIKMVKTMFQFCIELIKMGDVTIIPLLILHKFLPSYTFQQYNLLSTQQKDLINSGVVVEFIRLERYNESYELILTYLTLIQTSIEVGKQFTELQVPGLIFVITETFTKYEDWPYFHIKDKYNIGGKCLKIFFTILQKDPKTLKNEIEKDLYYYCKKSFMTNKIVMKNFLKILYISNMTLNIQMHEESNWESKEPVQVFKNVKLGLIIFLILSQDKKMYEETISNDVFPSELQRRNFMKVLAGYMQQTFDDSIPALAVKVLRRIAKISKMPIMTSLDLDPYQIQGLFLHKLRDPLVSKELKIAIVEFITICIRKQHGITAALFNITYDQKGSWKKGSSEDTKGTSLTQFLIEYLVNIKKSSQYLHSPLQSAVLNLLFNIWVHNKDAFLDDLKCQKMFWPTLLEPLIKTADLTDTAYSQILKIVSLEVVKRNGKNSENLKNTLKDMFSEPDVFVTSWKTHLLNTIETSFGKLEENSVQVNLLADWKNFLVASTKAFPDVYVNTEVQYSLLNITVAGLEEHFKCPDMIKIVVLWSELYLYLLSLWPQTCLDFVRQSFTSMISINKYFALFYTHFTPNMKATMIGAVLRIITNSSDFLFTKPELLCEYLEPVGDVMNAEFKLLNLNENKMTRLGNVNNDMSWVLLNTLVSNLLKMDKVETIIHWFQYYKILTLILDSLSIFIGIPETLHTAKAIVTCITNFAKSPIAKCYLNVQLPLFYDSIKPPLEYVCIREMSTEFKRLWCYNEWWQIYRAIIEINTILIEKLGAVMLQNGFTFMSLHLDIVKETFKLPNLTAELNALKLVSSLLNYCLLLLNWKQYWHIDNFTCFQKVLDGMKDSFNACISIILRPKTICFYSVEADFKLLPAEHTPNKFIVDIMNLYIHIISSCCKCFIKSSVHITAFLEYFEIASGSRLVENDFHVPKIQLKKPATLTFGSLLCTLHFLCKSTTQINLYRYAPDSFEPVNNPRDLNKTYIAFIYSDYVAGHTALDKFTTVQHFATSEMSSMTAPWLCHLNEEKISFALETLATFLAEEIFIIVNTNFANPSVVQYIRRELCSELQTFHEFIRKKATDLHVQKELSNRTPNEDGISSSKIQMDHHIINYLLTISQWFIFICDLSH